MYIIDLTSIVVLHCIFDHFHAFVQSQFINQKRTTIFFLLTWNSKNVIKLKSTDLMQQGFIKKIESRIKIETRKSSDGKLGVQLWRWRAQPMLIHSYPSNLWYALVCHAITSPVSSHFMHVNCLSISRKWSIHDTLLFAYFVLAAVG